MSLDSSRIDSMEQNQPQMSCYSESYQHLQKQHYALDTSTSEPLEYDAVSSTSHLDMGLGLNESCRFIESDPNTYPIILNREAYLTQSRVGVTEDLNKPKAVIRPTVTREFVSTTGEKFVLSHLVQHPTPNGRNVTNEGVKKRKRTRTAFTDNQIKQLEDEYASNRYVDQPRRQQVAKSLNLFERTVKIWFQNRRMKEKKMIREANEQSGDEDPQRDNFRREYYAVPTGAFPNSQPSTPYEVPQMSNSTTPNNSYGYGMCPPTYNEAVSFYPSNSQHYSVIIPDSTNIMNMDYNGQNNGFSIAEPSVLGYSTQNDTLRTAMSTLNVEDTNRTSNMVIEKYSPQTFATDEEMKNEVTCSEKLDSEVISGDEISKNEFINLDSFFQ